MYEPVDTTDMTHAQITSLLFAAPDTSGGRNLAAVRVFCAVERWTKEPSFIIADRDKDGDRTYLVNWDLTAAILDEHQTAKSSERFVLKLAHNLATGETPRGLNMTDLWYLDDNSDAAHRIITVLAGLANVHSLQ